jgi:hypothetical protein
MNITNLKQTENSTRVHTVFKPMYFQSLPGLQLWYCQLTDKIEFAKCTDYQQ